MASYWCNFSDVNFFRCTCFPFLNFSFFHRSGSQTKIYPIYLSAIEQILFTFPHKLIVFIILMGLYVFKFPFEGMKDAASSISCSYISLTTVMVMKTNRSLFKKILHTRLNTPWSPVFKILSLFIEYSTHKVIWPREGKSSGAFNCKMLPFCFFEWERAFLIKWKE